MRRGWGFTLAVLVLLVVVPTAQASYHLMKITEVGQGSALSSDYVELQMYAPGQNLVANRFIRTYDETGAVRGTFTFPGNVASGQNQRTLLVSREGVQPGPAPDFYESRGLPRSGAVLRVQLR